MHASENDGMPSGPRRNVRRLLIGLILVFLTAAGLWWMTRSTIDPRFVGSWRFSNNTMHGITLHEDGMFIKTIDGRPRWGSNKARWSVRGNTIIIEYPSSNPLENAFRRVALTWSKSLGTTPPLGFEQIVVDDVEDRVFRGTIYWMSQAVGSPVVLEKIDEEPSEGSIRQR